MFTATDPSAFLDYWRVPYGIVSSSRRSGLYCITCPSGNSGAVLAWVKQEPEPAGACRAGARLSLGSITVVTPVLDDAACRQLTSELPGRWSPAEPLTDAQGSRRSSVWRSADGGCLLPFDPDAVLRSLWNEDYCATEAASSVRSAAQAIYYHLRPAMPRSLILALRRRYARVQARQTFPAWPVEETMHHLRAYLAAELRALAGEPVPYLATWPDGHEWALVLTHDVETASGLDRISALRAAELDHGWRSSWNIVPERYDTPDTVLQTLIGEGCEVGVHGLLHDGRDVAPEHLLERLPRIRDFADKWQAVGFRSPATHRSATVMPQLGFQYDSSFPDTDPFEPQAGGCATWLPYFLDDLVELPITLVQDHTMLVILERRDNLLWTTKADRIRAAGGMVLVLTHPDYVDEVPLVEAYQDLLDHLGDALGAWHALPREVACWWRDRSASELVPTPGGWCVRGPAATGATVAWW